MPELISIDQNGAHVVADSIFEKLKKKNLSPSMISGLEKCPASWLVDSYVIDEIIEKDPDNAARRGNIFHTVMEVFFALPKDERTPSEMKRIVKETLLSPDYVDIGTKPEVIQWLRQAVNGYYNMGGKPELVDVAELEVYGERKKGLEIFVKGPIGEATRPVLGFIDQVIEDPLREDGSVIIQDWKSGAKAKKWDPNTKSDDGLAEQRQQIIYSELLRSEGVKVSGARLIYPIAREVVNVDLGDEDLRQRVISDIEETDAKFNHLLEENTYEFKPSVLCAWCPLSRACPAAMIKPYEKMQTAYASQPPIEVLAKGIDFH